jgi:hypothetical protein
MASTIARLSVVCGDVLRSGVKIPVALKYEDLERKNLPADLP